MDILTMSDVRFLPQVLCLYRSLAGREPGVRLHVLCMDAATERFLHAARLPDLVPVPIAELERRDPALLAVRGQRSWIEYCWTATPAFCRLALDRSPTGAVMAWIDADMEFVRSPFMLLEELGEGSILLTPHRYYRLYPRAAPAWLLTDLYGAFNGGAIVFRRDEQGLAAARLWRQRSLAWCHDRVEDGRFGNQAHLGDFPDLFPGARVLDVPGGGLGPWNAGQYRLSAGDEGPLADGRPVAFYHFQSLRLHGSGPLMRGWGLPNFFSLPATGVSAIGRTTAWYRISRGERKLFWRPYMRRLGQAVTEVAAAEEEFAQALAHLVPADVADDARHKLRLTWDRAASPVRERRRRVGAGIASALPASNRRAEVDRARP